MITLSDSGENIPKKILRKNYFTTTTWGRVLPEKITIPQLVRKFPTFN